MGSSEFGHWLEFLAAEELGPDADRNRWGQLMAALMNGPLTRKDKGLWKAAEFLPKPFAPPPEPLKPTTGASPAAFAKALKQQAAEAKAAKAAAKGG